MKNINKTIMALLTSLIISASYAEDKEAEALFFDNNNEIFYKIGGINRVRPPLTPDTNITIGVSGSANLGYSCGKFDVSAAFKNLMDNFKDGVDDGVEAVTNTANAAISSLPSLMLQRRFPGLYDMFQEYKLDAETEINIANKSCEEMEADIARGDSPYADFFKNSKAEVWKEEADNGTDITDAKEKSEETAGDNGVTQFGEKVGGIDQPPMKVVMPAVVAGYNYANGNTSNPMQMSSAPNDTELGQNFANSDIAATWATDVLGEFEINNKKPITKIGSGLHPKVKIEKEIAMEQLGNKEYTKLGFGPVAINKIKNLSIRDQGSIYANLISDVAIERVIRKSLIIRRLLLSGNQAEASDERDKKIALLERDIESLMFERRIKQELTNNTILEVLKIRETPVNQDGFKMPEESILL